MVKRRYFVLVMLSFLVLISISYFIASTGGVLPYFQPIYKNKIPTPRAYMSCEESSITNKIYCFGGGNPYSDEIISYDIYKNTSRLVAKLPEPRAYLSCVESHKTFKIYCFGGRNQDTVFDDIILFNPRWNTVKVMRTKLPDTYAHFSCARNSGTSEIYCFAGSGASVGKGMHNNIFVYDVSSKSLFVKQATFPDAQYQHTCTENSETHKIYCFGGAYISKKTSQSERLSKIFEYAPKMDVLSVKSARLPEPGRLFGCEALPGTHKIYCFGGDDAGRRVFDNIIEYDSYFDKLDIVGKLYTNTTALSCTASFKTNKIYCFGGLVYNESDINFIGRPEFTDKIIVY